MEIRDRYRGCLLGLAVGDAVGTTLEFRRPGLFDPIDDMTGGGPREEIISFAAGLIPVSFKRSEGQ